MKRLSFIRSRFSLNYLLIMLIFTASFARSEESKKDSTKENNKSTVAISEIPNSSNDGTQFFISAEGNIQGVLTNSSDEANGNTGALGLKIIKRKKNEPDITGSEFLAKITLTGNADTVGNEFGASILNPLTGSRSAYIDWRLWKNDLNINDLLPWNWLKLVKNLSKLNLHLYGGIASKVWVSDSLNLSKKVTSIAWGIQYFYDFLKYKGDDGPFAAILDVGIASRGILGDITGSENKEFRMDVLGTDIRNTYGFEIGLTLIVKNLKANFNYLNLFSLTKTDAKINGLTHGQIVAGISIQADINLNKQTPENK